MFYYFILFLFGLTIGSFLNVISLRYRPGGKILSAEVIRGRSRCPACGSQLKWYELIPIFSFLVQKRKCRYCGKRLFWQYPLVELFSGLIFVFVPLVLTNNLRLTAYPPFQLLIIGGWLLVFLLLLFLSIIDFRHYIIPDSINLSLAVLGVILIIFNFQSSISQFPIFSFQFSNSFLGHYSLFFNFNFLNKLIKNNLLTLIFNHFAAAFIAMLFFGAIILISRGKAMGWGDFKFIGALGLIFGWPDIIMVLALAFLVGGAASSILLIKSKKKMKDAVPFGPFLAIGAALTFFFGYQIIDLYFKLFSL